VKRVILVLYSVVSISLLCTAAPVRPATMRKTIYIDHFERSYLVHIPLGSYSANRPVVMMLHGRGGTAQSAADDFGWIQKADQEGFIVVFPQALPIDPARPFGASLPGDLILHWTFKTNDSLWWTHTIAANYPYLANPEYPLIIHPLDAPFLEAVFQDVLKNYDGGKARWLYVVGFSSGGEMASDFAQSTSTKIAAVAIVGSIGIDRPHQLTYPVSAFLVMGADDGSAKAAWNSMSTLAREKWYGQRSMPTMEQDVAVWARLDSCKVRSIARTPWGQEVRWSNCLKNAQVNGFSVTDLGHEWPGSEWSKWNQTRPNQPPLRLTDTIWDFFRSTDSRP
jgi:polyhydroxybutyrate depolymerase